jgi:hypothetical protein
MCRAVQLILPLKVFNLNRLKCVEILKSEGEKTWFRHGWTGRYELLPDGCFISALLKWNFTCSHLNPADVRWTTHARQVYVFDMHGYASIDDIPMKVDDEQVYPNVDLTVRRHFELATELIMHSDQDYFYVDLKRQLWNSNQTTHEPFVRFVFNGKHKRQFHWIITLKIPNLY